jgi:acyl-coenzyme A thioesterase 13
LKVILDCWIDALSESWRFSLKVDVRHLGANEPPPSSLHADDHSNSVPGNSVFQVTMLSELEHTKHVWERMKGNSPIYDFLLSNVSIVSASKGVAVARLTLEDNHVNSRGTIHGAVTATLVDWIGGIAIATYGLEKTGSSIDIHVSYCSGAQIGETVEIEAIANRVGMSIAFTTIKINKLVDGQRGYPFSRNSLVDYALNLRA